MHWVNLFNALSKFIFCLQITDNLWITQIFLRIHSPIRFLPAIGVIATAPQNATSIFGDPAGAHYRTLLMFFMFQNTTKICKYLVQNTSKISASCRILLLRPCNFFHKKSYQQPLHPTLYTLHRQLRCPLNQPSLHKTRRSPALGSRLYTLHHTLYTNNYASPIISQRPKRLRDHRSPIYQ